jgi:flavin-binding protein dodecin
MSAIGFVKDKYRIDWDEISGRNFVMTEQVSKIIEIVGTSKKSVDDAIKSAVKRTGSSVRNMRWFEVVQIRGHIDGSDVDQFQVILKIGFSLD